MPTSKKSGLKIFTAAVVAMVAGVIAVGLYVAGSPAKERERRFDEQRANELQQISNAVDSLYYRDGRLPDSLAELGTNKQEFYVPSLVDPKTGTPYEYMVTGEIAYDLCATFDDVTQQTDPYGRMKPVPMPPATITRPMMDGAMPYPGYRDWTHPAGYHCYNLTVENRLPNQACSLTNPCQAGQTCAQLPDRKGTYCVPAGKECLAAGCAQDKCVIMESYPVQVRCTTVETAPAPSPAPTDCTLMQEKKTGRMECFGCGSRVCKDPAPGWEPYTIPPDSVGIPYACYDDANGACALAQ